MFLQYRLTVYLDTRQFFRVSRLDSILAEWPDFPAAFFITILATVEVLEGRPDRGLRRSLSP